MTPHQIDGANSRGASPLDTGRQFAPRALHRPCRRRLLTSGLRPDRPFMPASFLEALEFINWMRAGVAGWRYLVSSSFRHETHARWKHESRARVLWDVVCGVAGIAFTLLIGYVVISSFTGWNWIQRLVA